MNHPEGTGKAGGNAETATTSSVDQFFERPILNSPYEYPARHWELDAVGQPTHRILERRRPASFISPIPHPKRQRSGKGPQFQQVGLVLDEGEGLSTEKQQYLV